jgi:hypothetical protein
MLIVTPTRRGYKPRAVRKTRAAPVGASGVSDMDIERDEEVRLMSRAGNSYRPGRPEASSLGYASLVDQQRVFIGWRP